MYPSKYCALMSIVVLTRSEGESVTSAPKSASANVHQSSTTPSHLDTWFNTHQSGLMIKWGWYHVIKGTPSMINDATLVRPALHWQYAERKVYRSPLAACK